MATDANKPSRRPATKTIPQYEADDGPLSRVQLRQIKKRAPQGNRHSLRSSLLAPKPTEKQTRTNPTRP